MLSKKSKSKGVSAKKVKQSSLLKADDVKLKREANSKESGESGKESTVHTAARTAAASLVVATSPAIEMEADYYNPVSEFMNLTRVFNNYFARFRPDDRLKVYADNLSKPVAQEE